MCAIGPMLATFNIVEVLMDLNFEIDDSEVDHFLISTRENQFLLVFLDQVAMLKETRSKVEDL